MKKSKALLSVTLCSLVVAGSAVGTNAATALKPHSGFDIISNSITVKDNTLNVYTYNLDNTATGGIKLAGNKTGKEYTVYFKNCISKPKVVNISSGETYDTFNVVKLPDGVSGSSSRYNCDFTKTGGKYVRMKVKLSAVDPTEFNNNGTHTEGKHTYKFKYVKTKDGYLSGMLYFMSGSVVTAATPDSNGYAELYMRTKVGESTIFATSYNYSNARESALEGGRGGTTIKELIFGNLDFNHSLDVNDATLLQQYLSSNVVFDKLQWFYADINQDGKRDISDVTKLQFAISE